MRTDFLLKERIPLNRHLYREAERKYAFRCKDLPQQQQPEQHHDDKKEKKKDKKHHHEGVITHAVGKVREKISSAIHSVIDVAEGGHHHQHHKQGDNSCLAKRLEQLELENKQLKDTLSKLEQRVAQIESKGSKPASTPAKPAPAPAKPAPAPKPAAASAAKKPEVDDDDDFELFGDELVEETAEQKKIKEQRLKMYAEKKQAKPAIVAKSSVLLDVKPWDDETDMKALESSVRSIKMDGLVWGTSKLVPVAFKIKKLQIQCVIEDDKVSTEVLEEKICEFEDYVQSVDIASFNKI